jgi:glucose/arabinose dehydrogenase/PKD repeat protein
LDSIAGKARLGLATALVVAAAFLNAGTALGATYSQPGFHDETIVGGLTIPTTAAWAPDGRLFIAEKSGVLKVLNPGESSAATILDINPEVNDAYDHGLLGLALDTDYDTNHYVYLLYTAEKHPLMADTDAPTFSHLDRVQVSGSNVVSDRTTLLGGDGLVEGQAGTDCVTENFVTTWPSSNDLDCIPSEGRSHSIGTVVSAPDGTLYVGSGDASSYAEYDPLAFRVYDNQSLAGKILHIDRDGRAIPGPHPFCSGTATLDDVCAKIYARGFRNPFRFKLRSDGTLTVGDVGWNTREEIDLIGSAGHSYGWPCYEGTMHTVTYKDNPKCDTEYANESGGDADVPPAYDYPHTSTNAVVGGPVYPDGPYPDLYDGQMFFGDYSDSFLKLLPLDSGGAVAGLPTVLSDDWMGADLVLTPDGTIAYPDFGTGEPGTGSIKEIVYAGAGAGTPHAAASANPVAGGKPLDVTFSAAESSDPERQALTYDWDFGDGTPHGSAKSLIHRYVNSGPYDAAVTVKDPDGHTDTATVHVDVFDDPPTPTIETPVAGSTYRDGDTISLHGSATDGGVPLDPSALSWSVILHHGAHTHFVGTFTGTANPSFVARRDHDTNSFYEVRLRATDSDGEWRQTTIEVHPEGVPFQILSSPAGAPVSYSGVARTAPFSTSSAIGLQTAISAAARFTQGGTHYFFDSWSDGGARLRQLEIPDHATSHTARYVADKAFNRPANTSSVQAPDSVTGETYIGGHATDDDRSTRWSSKKVQNDATPSWQVDLGSLRSISAVEIDWETAYASKYDILSSEDGSHWAVAAHVSLAGAVKQRTAFAARLARYVKVLALQRGTGFGVSFYEARVLGPPDDTTAPETTITAGPSGSTTSRTATFAFASEPGAVFECSLDGAPFGSCASPRSYAGLAVAGHSFAVRARDRSGNVDPTPAARSWVVRRSYADLIRGTRGLRGYWTLGDAATRAADLARGHRGRYLGRPARADGLIPGGDGARRFDGGNDRLSIPAGAVGRSRSLTVEMWVKRAARTRNRTGLLATGSRTPLADGFTLYLDRRHRPVFALGGTRGRHGSITGPALKAARAYHLAATSDGRKLTLYVDGRRRGTRKYRGGIAYKRGRSLLFGGPARGRAAGLGAYAGVLDEVAVYNRALGASTVGDHFRLGSGSG